ncbi:MAG TPA: lysylphosphatidylglycerol synthase transmembrane domain-containing protein [Thermoleophilaceae bacterium]|nr:lysylphosphatidylglycerol synthase transmembrane domain-containing protein [Thermoleophilaceae bacterium]
MGLCAAGLLVLVFLQLVNFSAVANRLQHLRIGWAVLAGAVFLTAYVVRAMRWRCLLRPCEVSIGRAAAIYQVATFINFVLPIRGGELVKSLLLRHSNGIPVSRSLATVSMDKAMDLLPAVALLALLPVVGFRLSRLLLVLLLTALAVIAVAAFVLALAAWRRERALELLTRLAGVLPSSARRHVEPMIVLFLDTLLTLVRRPRLMLVAAAWTAVAVSFDALFCLLAFKAVGVAVAAPVVLYGYTFCNLAFILPTPPGQIGSNEVIGLLIFSGALGVNRVDVGAVFLFIHPWSAVLMTLSALLCLSTLGLSLRKTFGLARARETEDRND